MSGFATTIGKTYQYSVVSDEPVNVAVYRPDFSNVALGTNSLVFTAQDTTSRLYVTPRTQNTVVFSSPTIKEIPDSALIFENGSIDGSDRLLVTEKQDGSGFVGETGTEYDYANGAAPPEPVSIERYFTQLDGQGKYWRRIEPNYGQTTTATLECSFTAKTAQVLSIFLAAIQTTGSI